MIYDKDFLLQLDTTPHKETYVCIIALDFNELPIEQIEGRVTQGSINIDGNSAVRRTFNLSLIAEDIDINEYLWGIKTKCILEIGLKNNIDNTYPEIIWFKQGVFVITAFNTTHNANSYTISISGKDKMCLLNGDMGGNLTASIDFGVEEFYDIENKITTYTNIPIKTIIRESLRTYAQEQLQNIVINDLDETAVELLEYKGDTPMYLLLPQNDAIEEAQFTMNNKHTVMLETGEEVQVDNEEKIVYDQRLEIQSEIAIEQATTVYLKDKSYTIAKVTFGDTIGYKLTDLTYAGDLISNIGESLTSIYDKIVKMLGNYEYFYDVDGKFTFQRKQTYLQTPWNSIISGADGDYAEASALAQSSKYIFEDGVLITAFQNSPQLNTLKNDFSLWGKRESVSGAELPIHYRYAIEKKPESYTSITVSEDDVIPINTKYPNINMKKQISVTYTTDEYDWREILYQMAKDYYTYNQLDNFLEKVNEANPQYPGGITGYEAYYIDIQGFWRQLYDIDPQPIYENYEMTEDYINTSDKLAIKNRYKKITLDEAKDAISTGKIKNRESLFALITIDEKKEMRSLLEAIQIDDYYHSLVDADGNSYVDENGNHSTENILYTSTKYFIPGAKSEYVPITSRTKDVIQKEEIYVKQIEKNENGVEEEIYKHLIEVDDYLKNLDIYQYTEDDKYYTVLKSEDDKREDLTDDKDLQNLYYEEGKGYIRSWQLTPLWVDGKKKDGDERLPTTEYISYYKETYEYVIDKDQNNKYWNKDILEYPEHLNFWIDFLDAESNEMEKYAVKTIGNRPKVINDDTIKSIYFREVPNIIFMSKEQQENFDVGKYSGYALMTIQKDMENLFSLSSQGKSAKDVLDEVLYQHSYCAESVTISALPIYYLQPNTRISVRDDKSKIYGDYIVSRISIPLAYNGVMQITATKAPNRLY